MNGEAGHVLQGVGTRVGDYQLKPDKELYNNEGPKCAKCGKLVWNRTGNAKPDQLCECPRHPEGVGGAEGLASAGATNAERQSVALEQIAVELHKINKHLEGKALLAETVAAVPEIPALIGSVELPVATVAAGTGPDPLKFDPAKVDIAANAAKKEAVMKRMENAK